MTRCMACDIMVGEFPEVDQRAAVCYTTYQNR